MNRAACLPGVRGSGAWGGEAEAGASIGGSGLGVADGILGLVMVMARYCVVKW